VSWDELLDAAATRRGLCARCQRVRCLCGGCRAPCRTAPFCRGSTQARRAAGGLQHACARSGLCARARAVSLRVIVRCYTRCVLHAVRALVRPHAQLLRMRVRRGPSLSVQNGPACPRACCRAACVRAGLLQHVGPCVLKDGARIAGRPGLPCSPRGSSRCSGGGHRHWPDALCSPRRRL